jgi:UDP-N-acetylglucosamine:LPS N-acetylglucosamine transferase
LKRILFISSYNTGYGHKSITDSLKEEFKKYDRWVKVDELDAFMLGGTFTQTLGGLYNQVAVSTPLLWKFAYSLGNWFPGIVNFIAEKSIKKAFTKLIKANTPDIIVTVHPGFVAPVISILKNLGLDIPVVPIIADLDNVSYLWADKRSLYTICPTKNAKETMLKLGLREDRLKLIGFPTRGRFNTFNPEAEYSISNTILQKQRLTFLLMNGSEGVSHSVNMAKVLLNSFDCNVVVLAGRNNTLKNSLEKELLPQYSGRVTVCGFINNVEHYMTISDILILRASPNVLMEAINLCKPVIVTGAFTGQEEKNPQFVLDNNLGVVCTEINKLPAAVNELLSEKGLKLEQIYKSQLSFRNPLAARQISQSIVEILEKQEEKIAN